MELQDALVILVWHFILINMLVTWSQLLALLRDAIFLLESELFVSYLGVTMVMVHLFLSQIIWINIRGYLGFSLYWLYILGQD